MISNDNVSWLTWWCYIANNVTRWGHDWVVDMLDEEGDDVTTLGWSDLKVEDHDTWKLLVGQIMSVRINFSSSNFIHEHWLILMQGVWGLCMGIG